MSWKDSGSGTWTWVDDGSGDPNSPPANPPPSANKTAGAVATRTSATIPHTPASTALTPATAAPPAAPTDSSSNGYPVTPIIYDPTTGQSTNGPTTVTGSAPDLGTNGQPRDVSSAGVDQNGNPLTLYRNPDGSAVITNSSGQIVQRVAANGQVIYGAPDANGQGGVGTITSTSPPTTSGGTGLSLAPPVKDIAGNSISSSPWRLQPDGTVINTQTGQTGSFASLPQGTIVTDAAGTGLVRVSSGNGLFDATAQPVSPFNANAAAAPTIAATQNNTALETRIQNQVPGDIARLAGAGGTGQTAITAAANQATNTGVGAYADATAAANAARELGGEDFTAAAGQGQSAINTANATAETLNGLAGADVANGISAQNTAAAYSAATGLSLQDAQAAIARLTALSQQGDVQATQELEKFTPNTGTAGQLAAFNPTATKTAGFTGSAGTANQLAGLDTNASATGQLGAFKGSAGTADQLAQTAARTGVSSTQDLLSFEGNTGTADQLANLNTSVDTSGLTNFQGVGQNELNTLDRIATGADVGPSAAEALLRKNADVNESQALALARSGRGAGENAYNLKQAMFQNAATEQGLGNDMAALRAQEAATARGQNIQAATAAAGTATTLGGQQLTAKTAAVQAAQQSVANRITALTQSGAMTQKQADQMLAALQSGQQGQLQSVADQINALTASGQLTQAQAGQVLDALKTAQSGQLTSIGQTSTNLTNAGQQLQTQSAQQLSALQSQQQTDLATANTRLQALVQSGQMTQAAAAQQLQALQTAQQGELALKQLNLTAASDAATGATNIATVNSDLTKAFANLGLSYDVNSGNVLNNAGQIVMTGQQVNANLVNAGLNAQVGQGQIGASVSNAGVQALTQMTNTSVDAQKAAATLGFQAAAAVASLSQGELSQLEGIVQSQNAMALQQYATDKGIALQVDAQNAQQTAATFQALGTIVGGMAVLSDINAKTDIQPMGAKDWFDGLQFNDGLYRPPAEPVDENTANLSADKIKAIMNLGGALGSMAGRALSDEKSKKDKKPESFEEWLANMSEKDSSPSDFRHAKGYSYEYKNPSAVGAEPGKQYGPMAQDLKKTAAADAVSTGPGGMLSVDPHKTIMPMMAALGEQQRRIDGMEHVLKQLLSKKAA